MNTSKAAMIRKKVRRSFFATVAILLLTGCDLDPATDYIQSATRPENVFRHDIWWIPVKAAGTNDQWFFLPEPAAVLSGDSKLREGVPVDVLVYGKIWRCSKNADGSLHFDRSIDPPGIPPNPIVIVGWAISIVVGVAGVGSFIAVAGVRQEAKNVAANAKAKERDYAAEQQRQADFFKKARDKQQKEDQRNAEATEALRAEREAFEQQKNMHMAAVRESKVDRTPPTQAEWETLSKAVRANQFRGQGTAQGLLVNYALDPKTSGAFIFQWEITWARPYAPTILISRDGTEIRRETGMFKGEFGSQLFKRNERHIFTFQLIDGTDKLPNPLLIELTLPPFDAWQPEPPKPMTDEERRQKREAKRTQQYQYAAGFIRDPQKLKRKKAEIDREILTEFGEE